MSIEVKFFASLRERVGKAECSLTPANIKNVSDVWQAAATDLVMPENTLVAINMEYVDNAQTVQDGDEVAFFPPVTGG
jgi:molybdopterin synthase sulfur carrier subunit